MKKGKTIRPFMKPRFHFVLGYWRISPTGVWKQMNDAEHDALLKAHRHAAKLNNGVEVNGKQ